VTDQEAPLQKLTTTLRGEGFIDAVDGARAEHGRVAGLQRNSPEVSIAEFEKNFAQNSVGKTSTDSFSASGVWERQRRRSVVGSMEDGTAASGGGEKAAAYSTLCLTDANAISPTCFVSGDPKRCELAL
jgi:hypothetical protein